LDFTSYDSQIKKHAIHFYLLLSFFFEKNQLLMRICNKESQDRGCHQHAQRAQQQEKQDQQEQQQSNNENN